MVRRKQSSARWASSQTLGPTLSRVCVNVMPVHEAASKRSLGNRFTVEVEPNTTIFDFKTLLVGVLTAPHKTHCSESNAHVPSVFIVHELLADEMSADTVSRLVMRRENYLRVDDTIGSYVSGETTTHPRRVHVVVLVITSAFGSSVDSRWRARMLETFLHSEIIDKTLPCTLTSLSPIFIRDDAVMMYRRICELLDLSESSTDSQPRPQNNHHETADCVVVTGSPGVGKTEFVWFLLHQLSRTHTVVFDLLDDLLLVRPDATMISGDRRSRCFGGELDHPETVYLKKASSADFSSSQFAGKTIVSAEPNRQWFKRFEKSWGRPTVLYMPLWSLSDLIEYHRSKYPSRADEEASLHDVESIYEHFGGLPQYVAGLGRVEDGVDGLKARIDGLQSTLDNLGPDDVYPIWWFAGRPFHACKLPDEDFCLELLHLKPSSDLMSATLEYATEFVRRGVMKRREELLEKCWCCSHQVENRSE